MAGRKSAPVVVLVTCASRREANRIAGELLRERRAACVTIHQRGESLYWWKGAIEKSLEYLLVAKTVGSLLPDFIATVKRMHSYEVPEIVALPIVGGSVDYLKWLEGEVGIRR